MTERSDTALLEDWSAKASEGAFAELARRYGGLLYHAAIRRTGRVDLAAEAAQNALLILELSKVGNPTFEQTTALRRAVIDASVALQRRQPGAGTEVEIAWERIPWAHPESLLQPGMEMIRATKKNERRAFRKDVVVRVLPEPEPGWVRVKLRSAE